MRKANGLPLGGAIFTRDPIGPCGGMVTGLTQPTAGTSIGVRCDVFGGAKRGPGETSWLPTITALSIPPGELSPDLNIIPMSGSTPYADRPGVAEFVYAPSDGNYALQMWCGKVYRSSDGAVTWKRMTGIPQLSINCNANLDRFWGRKMAIHPTNPDIAIVGTQSTSVYYTTNLTATTPTWTAITVSAANAEPNGLNPIQHLVAFNTFNPSEVWIAVGGVALLKSTTGVTGTFNSFATTAGGAAIKPQRLKFTDTGVMYFTQYGQADNLYTLANGGGALSRITVSGKQLIDVALDWGNTSHIVAATVDGTVLETTNGGTAWPHIWDGTQANVPPQQLTRASTGKALDAGVTREWSPAFNNIEFDRAVAGQVLCASGVGFLRTTIPTWVSATASPIIWIEDNKGDIPMLVTQCGVFAGDHVNYGVHDEGIWHVEDNSRYSNVRDQPPSVRDQPHLLPPINVQPCTDLRVASDNQAYVYAFQHGGTWLDVGGTHGPISTPHFGYNDNYGKPGYWHAYPTEPNNKPYTFGGGFMISGPVGHVAHMYNADGVPEYTEDGGNSWHNLNIPGLAAQIAGGNHNGIEYQGNGFWLNRRVGDYDAAAGKYRCFFWGGIIGFYEATNLSDLFVRVSTDAPYPGALSAGYVWSCHFKHVPGVANKAYWTNGQGTPGVNNFQSDPFLVTTDGCRNWTPISKPWGSVTGVVTFDFSAPCGPGMPPCMMFHGWVHGTVNNTFGFFRTDDDFATEPKLLAIYPMNWIDQPLRIVGNPNRYHDFRICYSGSGAIRVAYDHTESLAA